ncbi:MAG TPA: flavin reductase family protein [Ramlibacter sp.]|nr:flavin reductase family protein [Ramlibacter sp.]
MTTSRFRPVELRHASRLINHGPTVLVTSRHAGQRNIMAAAWSMPVEFTPPRIAIVIDKRTHTRTLAAASGVFGVCLPGRDLVDLAYAVGHSTGSEVDKFARFGIAAFAGPVTGVPLIEDGCSAWFECRLIPERHTEDRYDTCFAEIVSAAADPRIFDAGHWNVREDNADLHTIHHLGGGNFVQGATALTALAASLASG